MLKPLKKRLTPASLTRRDERRERRREPQVVEREPLKMRGSSKRYKGRSWPRHQGERECARRRRQIVAGQLQVTA